MSPRACLLLSLLVLAFAGCGSPSGDRGQRTAPPPPAPMMPSPPMPAPGAGEAPPLARLPGDVHPLHYTLSLELVPTSDRYPGTVEIAVTLDRPRDVIWLHGQSMHVKQASVRPEGVGPIAARWEEAAPSGVAALRLPRAIGPGRATIHIDFDTAFGKHLEGLYRVQAGGKSYAFTQFESIFARQAFPCFDEPAFKAPFDVTLFVSKDDEAIANTHEIEHANVQNGLKRVVFATTAPLPTYLVAFAVGPLDIVPAPPIPPNSTRKRPLPLRGIAARGKGKDLGYTLEHTGEILSALEGYFGIEYPYDKLDIIAVPEKGGAMENAGAVTFREWLVLLDAKCAPVDQQRAYAAVMAHELAHQWFGDLVTMPWWDDIWLNEAFATWMQVRAVQMWRPAQHPEIGILDRVHDVMGADSLLSARQIRQQVNDVNDIVNAFDGITYTKGGSVIAMFERWMGTEPFQRGIRSYLEAHRFGSATAEDLLASLSQAAQRDVATPFRTFLNQPGVPYVEAKIACDKTPRLDLAQSRYFPLGSTGDPNKTWQIPICARYPVGKQVKESCTLLMDKAGSLPFEGGKCPSWVLPNADGAGYFRWSLPAGDLAKLTGEGWNRLSPRERLTVAQSLRTGFSKGTTKAADVLASSAQLAGDPTRQVAAVPMEFVRSARDWLTDRDRAAAEAFGRRLYAQTYRDVGWGPKKGKAEDPERALYRRSVVSFLANVARDPEVRKAAGELGRAYIGYGKDGALHPEAVDTNLAEVALGVAADDGDAAFYDALLKKLAESDAEDVRDNIIGALSAVHKPELVARSLALTLDPRLKINEMMAPLDSFLNDPDTRETAWRWLAANLEATIARLPPARAGWLPWLGAHFCDTAHMEEVRRVFGQRAQSLEGGPRNFAGAVEAVTLCSARRDAQIESMRSFFRKAK